MNQLPAQNQNPDNNTSVYSSNSLPAGDEIDIFELLSIFWAKKHIIIAFGVLGILVGVFLCCYKRNVYESDSMLQLDSKTTGAAIGDISAMFDVESPAETEIRLISSRQVLMKVVEREHLNYSAEPIGLMDRLLRREGRAELSLFEIPEMASEYSESWKMLVTGDKTFDLISPLGNVILNGTVGETYRVPFAGDTLAIAVSAMLATPGQKFSLAQLPVLDVAEGLKKQLSVSEDGKKTNIIIMRYSNRYPDKAASVLNAIAETYVRQNVEMRSAEAEKTLAFLNEQLPLVKAKLDSAEAELTNFRYKKGTVDLSAEAHVTLDRQVELKTQLLTLEQERQEKSRLYTNDHPTMLAIIQKQERLSKEIAKEDAVIKDLPMTQQELLQLQQDVTINNELYTSILNNIQQLNMVRAGEIGNVRIVDTACIRSKPVGPKRKMLLGVSFLVSIVLGCGLILLQRKLTNGGVASSSEIERETNVSVYAKIPKEKMPENAQNRNFIYAKEMPDNVGVEKIRALRTALEFSFIDQGGKVLMVTGLIAGAGKTFVSVNLSYLFSQTKKRVLFIDSDLRKSRLSHVNSEKGLTDILLGNADFKSVVIPFGDNDFDYLPIGSKVSNPGEMLASQEFKQFVAQMKTLYDIVLIDTPPISLVSDAQAIAKVADFGLIILKYKAHSMEAIQEVLSQLDMAGLEKRAFVLNQCFYDGSAGSYGYYGGYKSNYKYAYKR